MEKRICFNDVKIVYLFSSSKYRPWGWCVEGGKAINIVTVYIYLSKQDASTADFWIPDNFCIDK